MKPIYITSALSYIYNMHLKIKIKVVQSYKEVVADA